MRIENRQFGICGDGRWLYAVLALEVSEFDELGLDGVCAGFPFEVVAAGGVLSYLTIRDTPAAAGMLAVSASDPASHLSCPLDAPPMRRLPNRG